MKCYGCGHEDDDIINPEKDFVRLSVDVRISMKPHKEVNLYACPKCGTVRAEWSKD